MECGATDDPVPPPRPQGGGKRRADDRAVLAALLYMVQAGCSWRKLPVAFFGVSRPTVRPARDPAQRTRLPPRPAGLTQMAGSSALASPPASSS
ncbi:transposase [Dactylosporangium cerinum]|uniref:Transposase n=1 Tax=Dactylosporangium cerinum TaxID=1434730 RepID=A0ABV9VJQ7_9ACTN